MLRSPDYDVAREAKTGAGLSCVPAPMYPQQERYIVVQKTDGQGTSPYREGPAALEGWERGGGGRG